MKIRIFHIQLATALISGFYLLSCSLSYAADLEKIITTGEKRVDEGKEAQNNIDKLSNDITDITSQYRQELKILDGLKIYNELLQTQVGNQQQHLADLKKSITNVAVIERQIVPLMVRMINSLKEFIKLDIPFLLDERQERIAGLELMLERTDVSVSEKFRRVLEAFQIEINYGKTLLVYRGTHQSEGMEKEVEYLRIGRIALLYQTLDGQETGVWNKHTKSWEQLPADQYRLATTKAIRIAKKQIAPELLIIPVARDGVPQ